MPQTIVTLSTTIDFVNLSSSSVLPQPLLTAATVTTNNPFCDDNDNSTSSSTSSDLGLERKRKRKWNDFYERLMMEVINKQEALQKKFLEAIEYREHERMVREEAWRNQEVARPRINHEREILAQEQAMAAAEDQAVMTFLQKVSEQ